MPWSRASCEIGNTNRHSCRCRQAVIFRSSEREQHHQHDRRNRGRSDHAHHHLAQPAPPNVDRRAAQAHTAFVRRVRPKRRFPSAVDERLPGGSVLSPAGARAGPAARPWLPYLRDGRVERAASDRCRRRRRSARPHLHPVKARTSIQSGGRATSTLRVSAVGNRSRAGVLTKIGREPRMVVAG
jgi:hypothetical protein